MSQNVSKTINAIATVASILIVTASQLMGAGVHVPLWVFAVLTSIASVTHSFVPMLPNIALPAAPTPAVAALEEAVVPGDYTPRLKPGASKD